MISSLAFTRAGEAQGERRVVARYAATGTAQGYVFSDGTSKVPDDAQLKAFETALRGLTFTLYNNETFDLQAGPGDFVFAFVGGRVGRGAEGVLYLHFRANAEAPITSMDGLFYPAGADPQANPARVTFNFMQPVPGGGTFTWHTIAGLKAVPVQ